MILLTFITVCVSGISRNSKDVTWPIGSHGPDDQPVRRAPADKDQANANTTDEEMSRTLNAIEAEKDALLLSLIETHYASDKASELKERFGLTSAKAEAVQETETGKTTTADAQDNQEVEGLLETAQEKTAAEAGGSSCIFGVQHTRAYERAQDTVNELRDTWRTGGGSARDDYHDAVEAIAQMERNGTDYEDVRGVCCLRATYDRENDRTIYDAHDCVCMQAGSCASLQQGGLGTRAHYSDIFLDYGDDEPLQKLGVTDSVMCEGC